MTSGGLDTGAVPFRGGLRAAVDPQLVRAAGVLAAAGAAFGVFVLVITASARNGDSTTTLFSGTIGGLYLATGVVACLRRPDNRVGLIMVLVGIGWFAEDIQICTSPLPHTAGLLVRSASSAFLVHLLLVFPSGRLRSRLDRGLVIAGYLAVFGLVPLSTLFTGTIVPNLLLVRQVFWVNTMVNLVQAAMAAAVVAVLVGRWFTATGPARRVLAPLYAIGLFGGIESVLEPLLRGQDRWMHARLIEISHAALILLPLAFLAGVWRARLGRSPVLELLIRLRSSPTHLEDLLARTLRDPSLRVGYFRDDHDDYIDLDGHPLPSLPGRAVTVVERGGRRVAALLHDTALTEDRHVLSAVASAAALELDNQRLTAELHAQLIEVRASRARIVAAGDEQRRRMERDLHDGAQQHLVTCALTLRMARQRAEELGDPDAELAALLDRSAATLRTALGELREVARGIHPAILSEAGLAPALRTLATRTPCPVRLHDGPLPELPPAVEATAYFVASEAITNVLKHAGAAAIRIDVRHEAGALRLSVADDGIGGIGGGGDVGGGADSGRGTGLLGLRDRVSALDGELTVRSPAGAGTTILAVLPTDRP